MSAAARRLALGAIVVASLLAVTAGAGLVTLLATGSLNTTANAWTIGFDVAGRQWRLNMSGLVRLATLPVVAHLLDGRSVATRVGHLTFNRDGARFVVRCAPCRVNLREVAAQAFDVREAKLVIERTGDRVVGMLNSERVSIAFDATLHRGRIDVGWELEPTAIAAIYAVFDNEIREARTATIEGTVKAQGRISLPARRGSIVFGISGFAVDGLGTERFVAGRFRLACRQPDRSERSQSSGDGALSWVAIDAIGPWLPAAVTAAEDQRFAEHGGYDETELARLLAAFDVDTLQGASTISQQLARTLFTGGERTVTRKLRELLYAVEMERTLGKQRILELYLNTVDWGPGICGAKAAARRYFNRSPHRLTPLQAAWLASILRRPHAAHAQLIEGVEERDRAISVLMQMRDLPRADRRRWAETDLGLEPHERSTAITATSGSAPRSRRSAARTDQSTSRQSAL